MADRHIDLSAVDIGVLQPPSSRRMIDLRDKRERGLALRLASKRQGRHGPGVGAIATPTAASGGSFSVTGLWSVTRKPSGGSGKPVGRCRGVRIL